MKNQITPGSYGYDVSNDSSPLYVVQSVKGQSLQVSERFDSPDDQWLTIDVSEFWRIA